MWPPRSAAADIVCFASIDWDGVWQAPQAIMSALARQGHRVLFVENTGTRPPSYRDWPRLGQRIANWRRGRGGFRVERERLVVFSPLALPMPYARLARHLNRRLLARALQGFLRAAGAARPVAWVFLPTPLTRELARDLEPIATVYHGLDDIGASSAAARQLGPAEARLLADADLVLVSSDRLRERALRYRAEVHLAAPGVDFPLFDRLRDRREPPPEIRWLPGPIMGYVGGIHRWFDQALLARVATDLPDASFVLVGPVEEDVSRLAACPNVHLLGARPHAALPGYIGAFDAGLIPYRLTEYTASVYPSKLNEYLAMGIPVVATGLPEIHRFNAEHGDPVAVGGTAASFAAALRRAVAERSPAAAARRVEVARRNSWDARLRLISGLLEDLLRHRHTAGADLPT
jgi:glycosyltransferase involved in cell wall biosynthesis